MSTGPMTWFGSAADPTDRSYFRVQKDGDGQYGDWEASENLAIHHVSGSDSNDLYDDGFGPEGLTLTLWFDSRDAYRAFRARRHTTDTLQLLANLTGIEGTTHHEYGKNYEQYSDVFLQASRRVTYKPNGTVECEVTFMLVEAV